MRGLTMTAMMTGLATLPGIASAQAPGAPGPAMHAPMGHPGGWGPGGWQGGAPMGPRPGGPNGGMPHPGGFHGAYAGDRGGYRRPFVGYILPQTWYQPNYYIGDWGGYGLNQPFAGGNWYRYYDDAVLVDGRGTVRDWRGGIDWNRGGRGDGMRGGDAADRAYDDGYADGFDDGVDYAEDAVSYRGHMTHPGKAGREGAMHGGSYGGPLPGAPFAPPPMRPGYAAQPYRPGGYGYPGATVYGAGGATVVVIQSAPAVTTTTTTTTYETVRTAKRVWHAPACRCAVKYVARGKYLPRGKMLRR